MNMRSILFTALCFFVFQCNFLFAQKSESKIPKAKIGISYASFGSNDVIRFVRLEGAASYNSDNFQTLGLNYLYPVNDWLEAEAGIEYSWHSIMIQPNLPPHMDDSPRKESFALVQIPITLRVNFWKYFFVNGGLFMGIDGTVNSPVDSQTGIGALAGVAVKYDFDNGLSVFVNPYAKMHVLIPLQTEKYHQRLLENGVRLGIHFPLSYKQ